MSKYDGLLVIGRERSGTKFFTNLLAQNFGLAAIQSEKHDGILESNLVAVYGGIFGNIPQDENRRALMILLERDYYFKYSHLSKEQLYAIEFERPEELLWNILKLEAEVTNKPGWVQKVSSRFLWKYKDVAALRVIIQRKIADNIHSHSKLVGNDSFKFILRDAIACVAYYKSENYYARKNGIRRVRYEDLKENPEPILQSLHQEFFGKELQGFDNVRYNNSSFKSKESKQVPKRIKITSQLFKVIFRIIPDYFFHVVITKYSSVRRPKHIMPMTFE